MVTPGIAAPDGSVTDPEMRPKLVCAYSTEQVSTQQTSALRITRQRRVQDMFTPPTLSVLIAATLGRDQMLTTDALNYALQRGACKVTIEYDVVLSRDLHVRDRA